jgi:hypothetical protein
MSFADLWGREGQIQEINILPSKESFPRLSFIQINWDNFILSNTLPFFQKEKRVKSSDNLSQLKYGESFLALLSNAKPGSYTEL